MYHQYMFDDSYELVIPRLHHTAFDVIINGKHYSSIKSLSTKSAFIYICGLAKAATSPCYAFRNTQLSSKIEPDLENSEVHICIHKMEPSGYVNEYKKLFKVWAISQTDHTPESFIPVKRILCKAATTNVNLKFMVLAKQQLLQFLYIVQLFCEQTINYLMKPSHRYKNSYNSYNCIYVTRYCS